MHSGTEQLTGIIVVRKSFESGCSSFEELFLQISVGVEEVECILVDHTDVLKRVGSLDFDYSSITNKCAGFKLAVILEFIITLPSSISLLFGTQMTDRGLLNLVSGDL